VRRVIRGIRHPNNPRDALQRDDLRSARLPGFDPAPWLTPRFDQLLRLYDKRADDSEEVADTLVVATKNAAASFEEMLTAMIIAGGGSVEEGDSMPRAA
jgi:hypothetical protein